MNNGLEQQQSVAHNSHFPLFSLPTGLDLYRNCFLGFVGLPDAASIEAAGLVESDNVRTVIIDASTAYRVDDDWSYGFPGTSNSVFAKTIF